MKRPWPRLTLHPVNRTANEDTIAAIATPLGEGGIGIVRLSGPDSIEIAQSVFVSARGKDLRSSPGRVFYGEIHDESGPVDEVLVHVMRAPHTYTCEDVVEINCHGGVVPLQTVLELLLAKGARLAQPGEFTKRAFLNGRIDLVQAEAVLDRIQARTGAALRAAASASHGVLSKAIYAFRDTLADALARIESAIDFPDEDLPELVDEALRARLAATLASMQELLATAKAGRLYREGASIAIAGRPNVGKSSLFNALLRDARAIVTAHPGTTRDLLEEVITLNGIPARLSDTAGLRATDDEVERLGIETARRALSTADVVIFLLDAAVEPTRDDETLAEEVLALGVPTVLAFNKIDVNPSPAAPFWATRFNAVAEVSAKTGQGLHVLEDTLHRLLLGEALAFSPSQGMITRVHQRDSLRRAIESLERLLANYNASPEFLSIDLRDALDALGEITGDTTPEDILDRIFSSFCIGK
ncbi:MAG: tRNA uridine-5-carboxymethylaminomethyl(34) synthesis GTPase MnmE [Candidatus Hydrogenedentes bacterium]|nr:tRNA uridine-5-carboxymethylaminomethyl(34) synthesis GTPase MnmE [Candidatus Hydrogenedentota bacterium]